MAPIKNNKKGIKDWKGKVENRQAGWEWWLPAGLGPGSGGGVGGELQKGQGWPGGALWEQHRGDLENETPSGRQTGEGYKKVRWIRANPRT